MKLLLHFGMLYPLLVYVISLKEFYFIFGMGLLNPLFNESNILKAHFSNLSFP